MAVSNQLRGPSPHKVVKESVPANMGSAQWRKAASGLDEQGVPAAMKLKSKKIVNLKLPANF